MGIINCNAKFQVYESLRLSFRLSLSGALSFIFAFSVNNAIASKQVEGADEKPELAQRCATCHTSAGVSPMPGWPPIAGMKKDDIIHKLRGYRSKRVPDSIMADTTHDLTDAQIEELADYYSQQPLISTD